MGECVHLHLLTNMETNLKAHAQKITFAKVCSCGRMHCNDAKYKISM